ncbi:MAG: glycosyltransferase [Desulfovibrio sp.]|nr:MAG: glycosyltransferase [Desulfovibrio sp.]
MIAFGYVLLALLFAHVGFQATAYAKGSGNVRSSFPQAMAATESPVNEFGGTPPRAAMIVPLTGDAPGMREALKSLLDQDYPNLEAWFVTKDEADPATPLIRELIQEYGHARHILSGPAQTCGQKNHALLTVVQAIGDTADILVFCDSTHIAHPSLVRDLLRPIINGETVLTSGYHRIVPQDTSLGTLGMLLSTQTIHLLQGFKSLNQPWGGAMAVSRKTFEEYDVAGVWSTNIVDDFSMGPHLLTKGIRCTGVSRACLTTPLKGKSIGAWSDWWMRQIYYLKFCMPLTWVAVSGLYILFIAPVLFAPLLLLGWALGWWGLLPGLGGAAYYLVLLGLALWCRSLVAERIPLLPWLKGYLAYFPVSSVSYFRTWFSSTMGWRGIKYRVGWGGRVKEIIRES